MSEDVVQLQLSAAEVQVFRIAWEIVKHDLDANPQPPKTLEEIVVLVREVFVAIVAGKYPAK